MIENLYIRWLIIFSVISLCIYMLMNNSIKYGRDLEGGTSMVFEVNAEELLIAKSDNIHKDDIYKLIEKYKNDNENKKYINLENFFVFNNDKNIDISKYFVTFLSDRKSNDNEAILNNNLLSFLQEERTSARDQNLLIVKQRINSNSLGLSDYVIKKTGRNRIEAFFPHSAIQHKEEIYKLFTDKANFEMVLVVKPEYARKHYSKIKNADSSIFIELDNFERRCFILENELHKAQSVSASVTNKNYKLLPTKTVGYWDMELDVFVAYPDYDKIEIYKKVQEVMLLNYNEVAVEAGEIKSAQILTKDIVTGEYPVQLILESSAKSAFSNITSAKNKTRQLAIVLNSQVQSSPQINEQITDGIASISGMESKEEARNLTTVLQAGSLALSMDVKSDNTISPTLGEESIKDGKISMISAMISVLVFMIGYYGIRNIGSRLAGVIACIALIINLLIIFSILMQLQWDLTLPGIAGLLLTVGMSVDTNVIIFERIKEEMAEVKVVNNFYTSIEKGYQKAFVAILDANLTTLIIAIILFGIATDAVKGFGVTLAIGILSSMFTGVFITQTLFLSYASLSRYQGKQ